MGHIKRQQAEILAPLMDNSSRLSLNVEGTIPRAGNAYTIPVTLDFHAISSSGLEEEVHAVTSTLAETLRGRFGKKFGFRLARSYSNSSPSPSKPVVQTKQLDWQTQAKELDDMFDKQAAEQLKELPDIDMPSHFADDVSLFDYQSIGIRWLVHQETKPANTPFFKP